LKKLAKVDIIASFYLTVSLLGLGLLAILTFNQTVPKTDFPWQKSLTGVIFSAICVSGIIAGLSPSRCSHMTHFKTTEKSSYHATKRSSNGESSMTFRGHHPTCDNFASHILSFRNQIFCAGCTGLAIGAIMSLAGSFLYFFVDFQIGETSILVFWLGFLGVTFGLLQYKMPINNGYMHSMLNVMFVLGAFLLLVGVNSINESLALNLYLLALSAYWILTRIELSRKEHRKKCINCGLKPCSLSFNN
jgi:hypothetical protein